MEQISRYIKIDSKFKYFIFIAIRLLLLPIARIFYGSKKIWVICERGDDAQDNGFVFFEYLTKSQKTIKPVFLIKKQSPDFDKVRAIGKAVHFGSFKHFLLCIGSRVKISSNLYGYAPWIVLEKYYRRNKTKDIHVFLQHGITKNSHASFLAGCNNSLSLFVTGAFPEYVYIRDNYGYEEGVVFYSGFPRFDNLYNGKEQKRELLVMPTWRTYLKGSSIDKFKESNFFKHWTKLLTNPDFVETCKKNNLTIKLYLHHEIQCYSECFSNLSDIHLVNYSESTVQKLLIESKALITDYSSVFFDFAYLHKPILFFQFDENEYYTKHYEKGYFDYRKSNLGDVYTNDNALINQLKCIFESDFDVSEARNKSIDKYFVYHDNKNCERIYNKIISLLRKK